MRKISCLVFMTLLSLTAVAQNFIQVEDDENNTVFYMDDNSNISHDLSDKMIITTGGKSWEYDVSKVKDIGIGITKPGIYEITQEELGEWEAGWLLSTGYYALYKANLYDNTSYVYINELCSEDGGWLFLLDENNEVSFIASSRGVLHFEKVDGKECLIWKDTNGLIVACEEIDDVVCKANQRLNGNKLYSAYLLPFDLMLRAAEKGSTIYGLGDIGTNFLGGDWARATYGVVSTAASIIAGCAFGPIASLAVAGAFYALEKTLIYVKDISVELVLGDVSAEIVDVERDGFKSCSVWLILKDRESIPKKLGSPERQKVQVGLYLRKDFSTVNEMYHSLEAEFYDVDEYELGVVSIHIEDLEIDRDYYVVPVLMPYEKFKNSDKLYRCKELARYGDAKKIHLTKPSGSVKVVENVELQTAEAICEYKDIWPEVKCGVRVKENSLFFGKEVGAFWGESENGNQRISLNNLNGDTSYSCEAMVSYDEEEDYSDGYTFTTKFPDISGTWNCSDGSGASYQIIISNDYAVWTLPDMYSGGIVTKGPDGRVDFTIVKRHTETVMGTGTWDTWNFYGTVNDRNHPTAIQGNVNNALGTPTISHNYEYEFTMSR